MEQGRKRAVLGEASASVGNNFQTPQLQDKSALSSNDATTAVPDTPFPSLASPAQNAVENIDPQGLNEDQSDLVAEYTRRLRKKGITAEFQPYEGHFQGEFDVGFPIRLEILQIIYGDLCCYEPELRPELYYEMPNPKTKIYPDGRLVIRGEESYEQVYKAFKKILPVLQEFRKTTSAPPGRWEPARI